LPWAHFCFSLSPFPNVKHLIISFVAITFIMTMPHQWSMGAARAHRQASPGPTRAPLGPTYGHATSVIHGSHSSTNGKPSFKSVWSRAKINSWWIDGPIVIDLELSTDLPSNVPAKFHHVLASQLPLGANQHRWMQRRCIQGPTSAPRWPSISMLPTNTPPLTLHYK
jgi:hypothetical protein